MATLLQRFAEADPDGRALVDEAGVTTWAAFDARVNRLISVLRGLGLEHEARVAVLSGNRREIFEVFAACLHAGFSVVPMNWNYDAAEAAFVLGDCDAEVLVVDDALAEVGEAAAGQVPVRHVLVLGDGGSYEAALAGGDPAPPGAEITGTAMTYTSGTTGRPKGVHSATFFPGRPIEVLGEKSKLITQAIGFPLGGTTLLTGTNYHSGQFVLSTFPLLHGATTVMRREPVPEGILETIDRDQVTNLVLTPTDFVRLLRLPESRRAAFDGSSLVQVIHTGAPCAPDVKRAMIAWWGPRITECYGASEGGMLTLITAEDWLRKPGSVGRVLPFLESRVVTDDGREAGVDEPGLVHFRHRDGSTFSYHKLAEKTAEAHLEPGLFTLGDVGRIDADGFLFLMDRKSEVINTGAVKLYPAEIEGALAGHPAVADVAVIGVPNEELGEEVKACVRLEPGYRGDAAMTEALLEWAGERLSAGKVPRSVDYLDELPRTDAGKLAKKELRDRYWAAAGRRI